MHKKDLEKAYEEIKVNPNTKAKMYNNILNKKRKKHKFIIPMLSTTAIALTVFAVYLNINPNAGEKIVNPIEKNLKENIESDYTIAVLSNAKEYMKANHISLEELKDNEKTTIDTKKIIKEEEYSSCQGTLNITRYGDSYDYGTSVSCGSAAKEHKANYKIYDGHIQNTYKAKDGLLITSHMNSVFNKNEELVETDTKVAFFDELGNVKWTYDVNKDVYKINEVTNIIQTEDKYVLFLLGDTGKETTYEYQGENNDELIETPRYSSTIVVLDAHGKEINQFQYLLVNQDVNYLGKYKNTYYYSAKHENEEQIESLYLIEIKDDFQSMEHTPFENIENKDTMFEVIEDGYLYGYTTKNDKNYLIKADLSGKTVKSQEIEHKDKLTASYLNHVYDNQFYFIGDFIYIPYEKYVYKYNKANLKVEKKILYDDLFKRISDKISTENTDIKVRDNQLIYTVYEESKTYIVCTDEKDQIIKTYTIDSKDLNEHYAWSFMEDTVVFDHTVAQIYTLDDHSMLFSLYQ